MVSNSRNKILGMVLFDNIKTKIVNRLHRVTDAGDSLS